MQVFVSWSGDISHEVALRLQEWLPLVIQQLKPYVSSEDIAKGARWSSELSRVLDDCNYGIICLTRTNLNSPWINFESGALSKSVETSRVSPVLLGLKPSEVPYPLAQFQLTTYTEGEFRKLTMSLNEALASEAVSSSILDKAFTKWWPELQTQLDPLERKLSSAVIEQPPMAGVTSEDTLEEILQLLREQQRTLNSLNTPTFARSVRAADYTLDEREALRDLAVGFTTMLAAVDMNDPHQYPSLSDIQRELERLLQPVRYLMYRAGGGKDNPISSTEPDVWIEQLRQADGEARKKG